MLHCFTQLLPVFLHNSRCQTQITLMICCYHKRTNLSPKCLFRVTARRNIQNSLLHSICEQSIMIPRYPTVLLTPWLLSCWLQMKFYCFLLFSGVVTVGGCGNHPTWWCSLWILSLHAQTWFPLPLKIFQNHAANLNGVCWTISLLNSCPQLEPCSC